MTASSPPLTAHDLSTAIRNRYAPPEWRVEGEVTLAGRRLDLVAFNLWAARNYRVVGFELKVDRGDWLRELDAFQKAEEWVRVVDAFYVVAPPKLIRAGELPAGWGHLELCGSRMMTRAYPAKQPEGVTLPRELVARFLGRMAQQIEQRERTEQWERESELRQEISERVKAQMGRESDELRGEIQSLRQRYDELVGALNVYPLNYGAHQAAMRAAGVLAAYQFDGVRLRQTLERATKEIGAHHARLQAALESLDTPAGTPTQETER